MKTTKNITISAILIGLGIVIPMFMPLKIFIPPATSFTLASHVPVMIAMFISPAVAVAVVFGTAWGFFLTFGPVVALRALSHVVFAVMGAIIIKKHLMKIDFKFNLLIGVVHAFFETVVVYLYLFQREGNPSNFLMITFLTIGLGGMAHSIVDFFLSQVVVKRLKIKA